MDGSNGRFRNGADDYNYSGRQLKIAKETAPQLAESGLETSGETIKVVPDDYGLLPVTGQLVLENEHEFIIARRHARVGEVHVHFPKQGFRREL